jgi:hypothetical protein
MNDEEEVEDTYNHQSKARLEDRQEKMQSDADLLIGARPQVSIMPGAVIEPEEQNYRFLCWNFIGSVAIREEMGMR